MKNRTFSILLILTILALALTACGSSKDDPEAVYWDYFQACENEKLIKAEGFLSPEAKSLAETIGVCGFTHDAINSIMAAQGGVIRSFSGDPEVQVQGDSAALTWFDDQGYLTTVFLKKVEGTWKILKTVWST